jgi:nicotinamidase-related amidase
MDTIIDKTKTALVVIDLQKGIVGMEGQPHQAAAVVKNAASLAEAFRKNNMPVFLVRVATSADGKDRLNPIVDGENPWGNWQLPPDWAEIVPEMGPKEGDFVITKKQWGAFYGTELDLQLRRRNIDTIVLCGIATNIGVESTARFAFEYGYQQIFAEDAMTTRSSAEHDMSVKSTFARMGRIRKAEDIIKVLLP